MTDFSSPFNQPPPSSHPAKSSLPMLYYGLVVVGTAAIVLVVYNFIVIRWCADRQSRSSPTLPTGYAEMLDSSRSFQSLNRNLLSSFRYKKGASATAAAAAAAEGEGFGNECAVCLSAFEDGEEVRKLPRCTHIFHAPCIDMWLYSHSDCPLCRAQIGPLLCQRHMTVAQPEHSGQGLLDSGNSV